MPNIVKTLIKEYIQAGFNALQAKQMAFAEYFEDRQAQYEYRTQGEGTYQIRIDCYCHDCKEGGQFVPGTVMDFIKRHKNHKTKTFKCR